MCGVRIELPGGGEIKSSGGSNPVSDTFNNINREVSTGLNGINYGLDQFGNDTNRELSNLGNGINRTLDETIGELNGRNKERAADAAQRLVDEQKKEQERLRQEEIDRMRRQDISASRKAGTYQLSSLFSSGSTTGSSDGSFNNLTRDFLGL